MRVSRPAGLVLALLGLALLSSVPRLLRSVPPTSEVSSAMDREAEHLRKLQRHLDPASAEAFKVGEKLERIEARLDGEPRPDNPDQFQRVLYSLRVPADRTTPEYGPNYRMRALAEARLARSAGTPLPWMERGPGNVAGRTRGLVIDPDDPSGDTWFIGTVGGGAWKTTDAGASWTNLTPDLPTLAASCLVMAESNHDVLYLGTGESMFNIDAVGGDGMFKSTDRGQTWTQLASTASNADFHNIARIVVDPTDPDVVVVAATSGRYRQFTAERSKILKSTDGGATWTQVFEETDIGQFNRVKKVLQIVPTPGDFDTLYAGVDEKGILKSTDAGDTWAYTNSGITDFSGRFELVVSPLTPGLIYAAAEGNNHSELWVSLDSGASWLRTVKASGQEPNWLGAQGWYDNTIVCHPTDPSVVYVGGIRLWEITVSLGVLSGGTLNRTSVALNAGVHVDHHNLQVIDPAGSWRLVNASDGGVAVSTSQASGWSQVITGLVTTQFYGVDKRPGGSAYIGGMQDNGTWRSPLDSAPADPWFFQIGGDGYETSWHFNDPLMIIGGYQYNGLQRSLDGGVSFQNATNGLGDTGGGSAPFITKIGKSNDAPDLLFAVGAQGVWRSADFGGSWSLIPLSSPDWTLTTFLDVKISRANPDVVWAGGHMDDTNGRIHVSTDGGLTFSPTSSYGPVTMGQISGLSTHPTDDQTAYALFSFAERPKILRTTDQGASWTDISGFGTGSVSTNGFPDVAVYDLLVRPDDPNILWAGTEIGLVESTNDGATWALADNGLPSACIWAMTHVEDEVVVATHGRGIWSVSIPAMIAGKTFSPLIENLTQGLDGVLQIDVNLRSAYDSTEVLVDGMVVETYPANAPRDLETAEVPVVVAGTKTVQLRGYLGGSTYESPQKTIETVLFADPQVQYVNDFDAPTGDFFGNGFSIGPQAGFATDAIHTPHPYADGSSSTYMLTVPILVAPNNATVEFDEVAIVEPGEPGSVFGDGDFWDYVIVEGSTDAVSWTPLADGYDARYDSRWLNAYNSSTPGDSTMVGHHVFDLLQTYSPGQIVAVRFRLYADVAVHGWGWTIDNLQIQVNATDAPGGLEVPAGFALYRSFPNPFAGNASIRYDLPRSTSVDLRVFDVQGRLVRVLESSVKEPGRHDVVWDGRNDAGGVVGAGVYFYRLEAGEYRQTRKMVRVR